MTLQLPIPEVLTTIEYVDDEKEGLMQYKK